MTHLAADHPVRSRSEALLQRTRNSLASGDNGTMRVLPRHFHLWSIVEPVAVSETPTAMHRSISTRQRICYCRDFSLGQSWTLSSNRFHVSFSEYVLRRCFCQPMPKRKEPAPVESGT